MKEWFYFQPGTYWIYLEETSGDLDTVHVYDAWDTESFFRVETQSSVLEEWIPGLWVKYNYYYNYTGSRACLSVPQCTCHKLERVKGRINDFVGAATILTFPFIENDFIYPGGGGTATIEELYDTLEVNTMIFPESVRVHNDICASEDGRAVTFYFSKNIGLIRKDYPEEEVWNLIDYNIIQ